MTPRLDQLVQEIKLAILNVERISALDLRDLYNLVSDVENFTCGTKQELKVYREKLFILLAEKCELLFDSLSEENQAKFLRELVDANILPRDER